MIKTPYISMEENDNIDFSTIDKKLENKELEPVVVDDSQDKADIGEYMTSLQDNYEANTTLFNHLNDLLNESEDPEKLMKILDSL